MKKVPQKQLFIFVLFLAIALAFSGCRKRSEPVENGGKDEQPSEPVKTGYEIIEPEKTDCADELDTSCWKTFVSYDYNFSIEYPNDWYLEQEQNYILIKNTRDELVIGGIKPMDLSGQTLEGSGIEVEFFKEKIELSLKDWIDEKLFGSKLSYTNMYIDGVEGKRVKPLDSVIYADPNIFIKNEKYVYNIRFLTTNENQYKENIKIFNRILTMIKIEK